MSEPATDRDSNPTVWFLSGDLIFSSRVKAAASNAGLGFRLLGSWPQQDAVADESVRFLIVDLSTKSNLLPTVVERADALCPAARRIAYGPHVQAGRLAAAREAGIETVLTRGQFDAQLSTLFGSLA